MRPGEFVLCVGNNVLIGNGAHSISTKYAFMGGPIHEENPCAFAAQSVVFCQATERFHDPGTAGHDHDYCCDHVADTASHYEFTRIRATVGMPESYAERDAWGFVVRVHIKRILSLGDESA